LQSCSFIKQKEAAEINSRITEGKLEVTVLYFFHNNDSEVVDEKGGRVLILGEGKDLPSSISKWVRSADSQVRVSHW
jgi:hypothetical protein